LINQINVKTKEILQEINKNINSKSKDNENALNELRQKQIEKIDQVKDLNSNRLSNREKFNEEEFEKKWSHVINNASLKYQQKIDQIKEEIILFDCVFLESNDVLNGLFLWITAWFYNQKNLEVLK